MNENTRILPLILHQTANTWRNLLDNRLKPLGLSQAKWRTLLHLSLSDQPLTQTALAQRMGIEAATLVGLLDRLEQDEWLERRQKALDRRVKTIHLTEKAQVMSLHIQAVANQLRDELLFDIPQQELATCIAVLQRIKEQAHKEIDPV